MNIYCSFPWQPTQDEGHGHDALQDGALHLRSGLLTWIYATLCVHENIVYQKKGHKTKQ